MPKNRKTKGKPSYFYTSPKQLWLPFHPPLPVKPDTVTEKGKPGRASRNYRKGGR
jgi:hypothetical protein